MLLFAYLLYILGHSLLSHLIVAFSLPADVRTPYSQSIGHHEVEETHLNCKPNEDDWTLAVAVLSLEENHLHEEHYED